MNGFEVLCPEFTSFHSMSSFSANTITGCRGDGVLLSADGDNANATTPNISIADFDRNQIVKNGGSGIVLEWDKGGGHAGAGYIFPSLQSNLIAGNVEYGILFTGLGTGSRGSAPIVNATIADNGLAGLGFEGLCTGSDAPDSDTIEQTFGEQRNNILWFNNGEGDQITGLGGLMSVFTDLFQHCNMQETIGLTLPGGQGNISADPLFVSFAPRDWHISANSPCIDAGHNASASVSKDMDDDDRIQDSDFDCEGIPRPQVDIGADEVPQPECE